MGKPIERKFTQEKTILKFFDYKGAACVVSKVGEGTVVKAGTPYPTNDASCLGYLLHDVDTTRGDAPGTYVYEGVLDKEVITGNGVSISAAAKAATPKVTFFGDAYETV